MHNTRDALNKSRGRLIIVAGPSGVGKTSLLKKIIAASPQLQLSISHTTRAPRAGEKDGQHYFFVSDQQFLALVKDGVFLEHALVFSHHYGTSKHFVQTCLARGYDLVLEIDWQGAQQVRRVQKCFSIFILPPSIAALKTRLHNRNRDQPAVIAQRLAAAITEIKHCHEFDQWIINDDYQQASKELAQVLRQCLRDEDIMQRARHSLLAMAQEDRQLTSLL